MRRWQNEWFEWMNESINVQCAMCMKGNGVIKMLPWGMISMISGFLAMLSSAHKSRPTSCDDCNVRCVLSAYDAISPRSLLPPVDWSPSTLFVLLLFRLARFRMINTTIIAVIAIAPAHPSNKNGKNILRLASDGVDASNDDVSVCFSGLFRVNTWRTVELLRPFALLAIKNTL